MINEKLKAELVDISETIYRAAIEVEANTGVNNVRAIELVRVAAEIVAKRGETH